MLELASCCDLMALQIKLIVLPCIHVHPFTVSSFSQSEDAIPRNDPHASYDM